jgi:hypothetical protein
MTIEKFKTPIPEMMEYLELLNTVVSTGMERMGEERAIKALWDFTRKVVQKYEELNKSSG